MSVKDGVFGVYMARMDTEIYSDKNKIYSFLAP